MRALGIVRIAVLSLIGAAVAMAPRSTAQELVFASHDAAPAVPSTAAAPEPPQAFEPLIGVEQSASLFMESPPRGLLADPGQPLGLAAQAAAGLRAFHITVAAGPSPESAGARALWPAGLPVVPVDGAGGRTSCATLMLCLIELDALARAPGAALPYVVVVDARPSAPGPLAGAARVLPAAFRPDPGAGPTWDAMLAEISTALPELASGRLRLVLAGGSGPEPDLEAQLGAGAPAVRLDGRGALVLDAAAPPATIPPAVAAGVLVVVVGADWSGEADAGLLGPREAAAHGAHIVIVTPETARQGEFRPAAVVAAAPRKPRLGPRSR